MENVSALTFDFWSAILLFGLFQGVFLAAILLFGYSQKITKWLLLILVLIVTLNLFNYLLINSGLYRQLPHLVHLSIPTLWLIGPCYYFYIKAILKKAKLRLADVWHLIPFLLSILVLLPFYQLNAMDKIKFLQLVVNAPEKTFTPDVYIFIIVQILHSFGYILASLFLLKSDGLHAKGRSLDRNYHWIKSFTTGFMLFWLADIMALIWYVFRGKIAIEVYYVIMLLNAIAVNTLVFFAVRKNKIFTQLLLGFNNSKYSSSNLNDTERVGHLNELLATMENDKPFLNPDLTLEDLANYAGKSKHLVSQVLNMELGKNFYEFINEYRLQEVKARLTDEKYNHLTILAIAYDSGFGNKNTFNKVFKEQTGKTPSQFQKENSQNLS